MELLRNAGTLSEAASLLEILGNERRLLIMSYLLERELSVTELGNLLQISQSALSQHLAKLRHLDLVKTRRQKQTIYYASDHARVRALINLLETIFSDAEKTSEPS